MKPGCEIKVLVVKYIQDQPSFLKCKFQDANGSEKTIIEKVPVLTNSNIDNNTALPLEIGLSGTVNKKVMK